MFKRSTPEALQKQLESLTPTYEASDEGEWKPTQDKDGNGEAVIRFLPIKSETQMVTPFAKLINHGFKQNGKWYIENCSSTHGDYDSCPVCQYISKNDLFNSNKALFDNVKRKTSFWANILVVKDPGNRENEGKVFKYRFGFKIMEKINAKVNVNADLGETPVDVTCPFDGANFVMKIKRVSKFPNYDDCYFLAQSQIPKIEDEDFQKFLFEGMSDLTELTSKDKFKDFALLDKNFKTLMGTAQKSNGVDDFEKQLAEFESSDSGKAQIEEKPDFDEDVPETVTEKKASKATEATSDDDAWLDDILNS